jgi:ribosome production factor 2
LEVLTDLGKLLKPNCKVMARKNELYPFEDANSIEFLTSKNDCALFAVGSHSKKRPNNLILGRTFDGHMLDMVELGVEMHQPLETFKGSKKAMGSKPLMAFLGDQWESDSTFMRIQNLLLDVFRGDKIEMISLKGMDHVLVFTVAESKIMLRGYTVSFKKSGTKVPLVDLLPMGPSMDMSVRRTQLAADDLYKIACKKPKGLKPTKVKNISRTPMGDKVGRIHVKKQNFDKMGGRRVTALREKRGMDDDGGLEADANKGGKRRRIV